MTDDDVAPTVQQRILVACGKARQKVNEERGHVNVLRDGLGRAKAVLPPSQYEAMKEALASLQLCHIVLLSDINNISSEFSGGLHAKPPVQAQDMPLHPVQQAQDDGLLPGARRWRDGEDYRDPKMLQANDHSFDRTNRDSQEEGR